MTSVNITTTAEMVKTAPNAKFLWRFLAIKRSDLKSVPCRQSVEAHTEKEARKILARHFILSFAARLPVQAVRHG
ncbi:host cell division inhibitor Icd-like protein [Budvicia aquatica]|uniref:Host cell division inhibitor Icd-like protein n=2 Tax=Budvicia aquatica TaxID=82979 RepID=A0A484ZVR2_9GAMM|nr:host cell division inhibitor Icd-like protein [Budvicia aquatica]VFS51453.1 Uncharacterised protein [Budvicia aquatica]